MSENRVWRALKLFDNPNFQRTLGIVFTILAIATLFVSLRATNRQQADSDRLKAYVKCQAEWNTFFYQAISAGRTANQESQAALDELITTVSTSTSREQSAAALVRYQTARAKQIQTQRENPLPQAPKNVCQLEG